MQGKKSPGRARVEMRTVDCAGADITYELTWKRVKNMNLRVQPDGSVHVSASPRVGVLLVDDFVRKNARFIQKALARYKGSFREQESRRRYESGESIPVLGRKLLLKVEQAGRNAVSADSRFLYLQVQNPADRALKERVIRRWLMAESRAAFTRSMERIHQLFQPYGIAFPSLKIRAMKSRWGSCMPAKKCITLNLSLFSYPAACIDYVVVHEFCHFIHANHSLRFYQLMAALMPDWKARKDLLESL